MRTDTPLWKLMNEAFLRDSRASSRAGFAAEIRTVADEVEDRGLQGPDEVVAWLRAEATRAEAEA